MGVLMEIMMKSVWITGYSNSLFQPLIFSRSKINILEKSLLRTCINPETGENFLLRLDHTIRDSDLIDFISMRFIYQIELPLEAFLMKLNLENSGKLFLKYIYYLCHLV
jgi:hypothetical protein